MTETAVIYSNGSQECERIGMLLKALGGEFHEYFLGEHFDEQAFYKSLVKRQPTHKLPMVLNTLGA